MTAQQPGFESEQAVPADQRVPLPDVPEPDMQSPLHPEAPGPEDWAQVVATGRDQVRSYLAGQGMPAEEIDRLIAEASRAGTVTFPVAPGPGRPGGRRRLSFVDSTYQLAIHGV
jgi:hypothetical protein